LARRPCCLGPQRSHWRQIVFMAPTRPLVAQQVRACFKIADLRQDGVAL
jgi:ERCC4-related helicase